MRVWIMCIFLSWHVKSCSFSFVSNQLNLINNWIKTYSFFKRIYIIFIYSIYFINGINIFKNVSLINIESHNKEFEITRFQFIKLIYNVNFPFRCFVLLFHWMNVTDYTNKLLIVSGLHRIIIEFLICWWILLVAIWCSHKLSYEII